MSIKCKNCGTSVFDAPLLRVNPIGQDGIWWCAKCLEKHEPELYKNLKEEETDVEKVLKEMLYGNNTNKL